MYIYIYIYTHTCTYHYPIPFTKAPIFGPTAPYITFLFLDGRWSPATLYTFFACGFAERGCSGLVQCEVKHDNRQCSFLPSGRRRANHDLGSSAYLVH